MSRERAAQVTEVSYTARRAGCVVQHAACGHYHTVSLSIVSKLLN